VLSARPIERTPAAASRRCRFRFTALLLVLIATAGCRQEPPDPAAWDGVRATLLRATRELRPVSPQAAAEIEKLVTEAEAETARQAVSGRRADPGRAPAAWNRAVTTANQRLAVVRRTQAEQALHLKSLLARAEPLLAAAQARVGQAGVNGRHAGDMATARYHVATARRLAREGSLSAALEHAEEALALTAELDHSWRKSIERFSDPSLLALWREQAEETIQESRRRGSAAIIVDKFKRRVHLYEGGRRRAVFTAELGGNGLERKLHAGDRATPEGRYKVTVKKSGGATKYYLALLIDYPNAADLRRHRAAQVNGRVRRGVGAGSLIEIHGHGGQGRDWTDGCVALRDEDMERLFSRVRVGTPVTIVGTL
jgi:hypothetical protein